MARYAKLDRLGAAVALLGLIGAYFAAGPPPARGVESQADLAPGLQVRPIGRGAYVVVHVFPWSANSLVVEMTDGTLVMAGTPYTPEATKTVLNWTQRRFGPRRMVAIDTGYHVDNLGGNAALLEAGVPVYGSDLTVTLLRERGETMRALTLRMIGDPASPYYRAHAALRFVPPDHVFAAAEGLRLTFGSESVEAFFPGPSQAPDKVVVYFASRRILFGSCMILCGDRPGNTADADLRSWAKAVQKLRRFQAEVIVPGHGDRLDPGLIQHTLDLLAVAGRPAQLQE